METWQGQPNVTEVPVAVRQTFSAGTALACLSGHSESLIVRAMLRDPSSLDSTWRVVECEQVPVVDGQDRLRDDILG